MGSVPFMVADVEIQWMSMELLLKINQKVQQFLLRKIIAAIYKE